MASYYVTTAKTTKLPHTRHCHATIAEASGRLPIELDQERDLHRPASKLGSSRSKMPYRVTYHSQPRVTSPPYLGRHRADRQSNWLLCAVSVVNQSLADRSTIEWTTATWNWATGCTKISEGCLNCYMFRLYPRLKRMGLPTYQWKPNEVHLHDDVLRKPFAWKEPRMIFTNSMSDFFHEKIPFDFLDRVLEVIRATPQHTYQVLTKRSWRMMKYGERIRKFPPNMWIGVSLESAQYKFRTEHLAHAQASVRFLSIEPLIGPVGKLDLTGIHWVIVGGESGPNYRPMNLDWAREIRDQCIRANVAFFFKQVGGLRPTSGGRLLDGVEWNQFPLMAPVPLVTSR